VSVDPLVRERLGTNVVFAAGARHVVKLSPPLWSAEAEAECVALEHVAGRLSVATPELVARGELEGWSYLVLTRVPGVPLERVWGRLPPDARARAARRAGALAAEHHALPLPPAGVPVPPPAAFVRAQTARALERARDGEHTRCLAAEIEGLLLALRPELEAAPAAFLNADITEEHLFVAPDGSGEALGLVDFADARVGAPEYDLVSFGAFLAVSAPALRGPFLDGAGVPHAARDPALARRLTAWTLLHRYIDLAALVRDLGAPPTLDALVARLWGA
jgi:hygromycin-B 7''-O-kinase